MNVVFRLAYISDQLFYQKDDVWYTSNGFPLTELAESAGGAIASWTFFGRLLQVDTPPRGALPVTPPPGLRLFFAGPRFKRRGLVGYLGSMRSYLTQLRNCIGSHDVIWMKANFAAAWLALPFLRRSRAFRISHQVGDPAQIAVGPVFLLPLIRRVACALTRLVHRKADLNVFVSRQLAEIYSSKPDYWIYNESRLRPTHIVDGPLPLRSLEKPVRLIYVGRLSPEKGVPVLLRAIACVSFPIELSIVGSGHQRQEIDGLAMSLGIRGRIQFLGAVNWGPDLLGVIRQSDILVLPSYTEGLGLVLLEAMSQGVCVVASNVGGIPEIVRDRVTGLLFPPGNVEALAEALTRLAEDDDLRHQLRNNALEVARENTLDRQLCGMFERLLARLRNNVGIHDPASEHVA